MKNIVAALSIFVAPLITRAATPRSFGELVNVFVGFINTLIVAIFALTFLVIVWGIVKTWIISVGNEKEVEKGKKIVFVGIITLAIMSGIWGILAVLRYTLFSI